MLSWKTISVLLLTLALAGLLWWSMGSRSLKASAVIGKVTTLGGRAVPQAEVTALEARGRVSVSALTNTKGEFEIRYLPAGSYSLEIRKSGFAPVDKPAMNLEARQTVSIDAVLLPVGNRSDP